MAKEPQVFVAANKISVDDFEPIRLWLNMPNLPWRERLVIRFPLDRKQSAEHYREFLRDILRLDYEVWIE